MRRFDNSIPAYLNGVLPDRRRRWFERQLAESEACRSELRAYRRLQDLVLSAPPRYPDGQDWMGFGLRIREQVRQEGGVAGPSPRRFGREVAVTVLYGFGGAVCGLMIASGAVYGASQLWRTGDRVEAAPGSEAAVSRLDVYGVAATPAGPYGVPGIEDEALVEPAAVAALDADGSAHGGDATGRVRLLADEGLPDPVAPIDLYQDGLILLASARHGGSRR